MANESIQMSDGRAAVAHTHSPSWGYLCKSLPVEGDLTTDVYLIRWMADQNGNLLLCGRCAKR